MLLNTTSCVSTNTKVLVSSSRDCIIFRVKNQLVNSKNIANNYDILNKLLLGINFLTRSKSLVMNTIHFREIK